MTQKEKIWDDVPSLENLSIDWEYQPENALGKRAWVRIETADLHSFLTVENIPVKIVTRNIDQVGQLIDISIGGLAILFNTKLTNEQLVRVGFFLGTRKVIARAIVRNVSTLKGKYRIGMEFVDLDKDIASYITSLISSKIYEI